MRSLIPPKVKILALTATATQDIASVTIERLCMSNVKMIRISPNRINIKYSVKQNQSINDLCTMLADELITLRVESPKTVVFCQTLKQCGYLYHKLRTG